MQEIEIFRMVFLEYDGMDVVPFEALKLIYQSLVQSIYYYYYEH